MAEVMTVTGPIDSAELGHTQLHEHLLLDSNRAAFMGDLDKVLSHADIAVRELAEYDRVGGRTLVEVTTPDLGRDAAGLRWIAEQSSVHVVMGMGFYRWPYYPEWLDSVSTDELADMFVEEIRFGCASTGVRPGIIGEIGSHRAWVSAQEERVFRAAGRAQARTGLALMTHTPPGAAKQHLDLFADEGADLSRVAVGHADTWLDYDYHHDIAARGAYLSFDQIGLGIYPDQWAARHVARLVREGYAERILLSTDIYTRKRLKAWGGAGYGFLIEVFLPLLREAGVDEEAIEKMTVENPRRLLALDRWPQEDQSLDQRRQDRPFRRDAWGLARPLAGDTWAPSQ
jgi:predicted metal-dependent phosphotriesterase family hydrolase